MKYQYCHACQKDNYRSDLVAEAPSPQSADRICLVVIDLPGEQHQADENRDREERESQQLEQQQGAVRARPPIPRNLAICSTMSSSLCHDGIMLLHFGDIPLDAESQQQLGAVPAI